MLACTLWVAGCGGDALDTKATDDGDGGGSGEETGGSTGSGGKKGGSGGKMAEENGGAPGSGGASEGGTQAMGGTTGEAGASGGAAGGETGMGGAPGEGGASGGSAGGVNKIFDGTQASLDGWAMVPAGSWLLKDGAMVHNGAGRGYTYAKDPKYDCNHCRILFSLKPGGTGGHAPTVLIFNTRAPEGQKGLDALGGIQFQPPNGGHWDYRPGKNTAGAGFSKVGGPGPAVNGWYLCEMIVNAETSEAKMACGGKDVLHYKEPTAGKVGPWAIQTHNKGITDAYKDIQVEEGLTDDKYMTVK